MEQKEKAIIVGVNLNNQNDFVYSMKELENLAEACDIEVVGEVTQNLHQVNAAYYIGIGKIQELRSQLECEGASTVIFNDELSPSQIRNIEAETECMVIDRTMLILNIFDRRARTKESQLQVEIAQLQYMLPRLIGLRKSLGRQSGGVGTKNRGFGEKKLELDRRKIETKITVLNKELEKIAAQRDVQRRRRRQNKIPVVSLVGYTNSGKSTLMNAMTDVLCSSSRRQVFEKDMLFATLDTSVRNITLLNNKSFLLADTVGFVSKLPHHLIKAFRSTLEEVREADLLVHVVDYANADYEQNIHITNMTIEKIGAADVPIIYAYNKLDLMNITTPKTKKDSVYLSAKNRVGIDELAQLISRYIFNDYVYCEMMIPYDQGSLISYLNKNAHILSVSYEQKCTRLALECKIRDYEKYQFYVTN